MGGRDRRKMGEGTGGVLVVELSEGLLGASCCHLASMVTSPWLSRYVLFDPQCLKAELVAKV